MQPINPQMINPHLIILYYLLSIWELIWKGIALWNATKNNQKYWYIFMLIINSAGILPIIYLLFFKKDNKNNDKNKSTESKNIAIKTTTKAKEIAVKRNTSTKKATKTNKKKSIKKQSN